MIEIDYLPGQHLLPSHVSAGLQISRTGGEKGLSLDKECNVDYPHSDCRRNNNPVPLPNCNASNINEHLI
jgi:hypothetical protein